MSDVIFFKDKILHNFLQKRVQIFYSFDRPVGAWFTFMVPEGFPIVFLLFCIGPNMPIATKREEKKRGKNVSIKKKKEKEEESHEKQKEKVFLCYFFSPFILMIFFLSFFFLMLTFLPLSSFRWTTSIIEKGARFSSNLSLKELG